LDLHDPFRPFMTDETLTIDVLVLNPPAGGFLAYQFLFRIRPGFSLVSFASNDRHVVRHAMAGDILTVRGDASGGVRGGGSLGRLVLRLEARHTGQLRPVRVQSFQFMVARDSEEWINVGVRTQGAACRYDGYVEAWTDFPRVVSLIARHRRTWLAHWRSVQSQAPVFPTGIDVLGVWNVNGSSVERLQEGVQCRSLTPKTLRVESCERVSALSAGQGRVRIQFQDQEAVLIVIQVVQPLSVATRFIQDSAGGRRGRLQVTALLIGRAVDVTPFVFSGRVQGGVVWESDGSVACSEGYTGNYTLGEPVLYQGLCGLAAVGARHLVVPLDLLLLTGGWTSGGSFRLGPARLSPDADEAGIVLLGGEGGPVHSEDTGRLVVTDAGIARLVRRGQSPRCVALTDGVHRRWMVPVMPPAPQALLVTLSGVNLVVQQDVWKLVPSTVTLVAALVRFSDGTTMDARGRLAWSASARLRVLHDGLAETMHEHGPANITFTLVGTPCLHATVPVRIHPSSVLSAALECESCPARLAEHTDPLARRWPDQYPSAVDALAFSVRRRLVDGTVHVKQEPLQVSDNGALQGALVVARGRGVLGVTTAFTRNTVTLEVLDRWAVGWRVLCNGRACDERLKLAPPGDGASLAPFRYATRLDLGFELTLLNGTLLSLAWLPQATLTLNGTAAALTTDSIPLVRGALDLRVTLSPDWRFATLEHAFSLRVDALAAFRVEVPPILYQMHCSRMWERGPVKTLAVLTDGIAAEVPASVEAAGAGFRLDATHAYIEAVRAGVGRVSASFGEARASQTVLASMESKRFTGVTLDSLPSVWTAPLASTRLVHAALQPFMLARSPALVRRAVVWWQVSPPGVMNISEDGELLTLLSDHYEPATVSAFIRGCQGGQPIALHRSVQVNVAPDQSGQADVGAETGAPLPVTPVGGIQAVPLFLFADRPLLSYQALVSLPGLLAVNCSAGELPFAACSLAGPSSARFTASFPASQRTGRLLLGVLHGRVLLDALSRLSVSVQSNLADSGTTFEFTARLGVEPVRSALTLLNTVLPGLSQAPGAAWDIAEPERLEACCDALVTCRRSRIAHLFPHSLSVRFLRLQPAGISMDLHDPRIQVEYDSLVLSLDRARGVWVVERDAQEFADTTRIVLRYTHPGSQVRHEAVIHVTLAKEQALILDPPGPLLLFRIHCSPARFQAKPFNASLLLRGGARVLLGSQDLSDASVQDSSIAAVSLGLVVQGLLPGQTTLALHAFGLTVENGVHVRGQSVRLRSIRLPTPYLLRGRLEELRSLELSGELEDGQALPEDAAEFLPPSITSDGPLAFLDSSRFRVLGNTHPDSRSTITATISSCEASGNLTASAQLVVRLAPRPPVDVVLDDAGPLGFQMLLAADSVVSFLVDLQTGPAPLVSCQPIMASAGIIDCSVEASGRIRLAGVFAGVQRPALMLIPVALVSPMPSSVSGTVEVFTGETVARLPVVAGHFGLDTPREEPGLPAVDTASLARLYHHALAHAWDGEIMRQARLTLELLTGRQRLVDARLYGNDQELSAMFRVTDRFFRPSHPNETRVEVVFHTSRLPSHPEARDEPGGGVRIAASYVVDGWLAVHFKGSMPLLKLLVSYEVSTNTSLSRWVYQDSLVTGRPVHACPRLATDRASFQIVYAFNGSAFGNSTGVLACTAGVAPRRVGISGPGHDGLLLASISVESFIRMHEVHQAIMQLTADPPHQPHGGRSLLQQPPAFTRIGLLYVNDTADPVTPCSPGTFFSQNGTYERLPQHAVAGPDCYNMSCLAGYTLSLGQCVPSTVTLELVWVCVFAILGLLLLVSCLLCALHLGNRIPVPPPEPVDLASDSWPGSSHPSEPFFQDENDKEFKNIMLGSYLDDYSSDMLDDYEGGDDFLATSRRAATHA
jgi:hypothetical protein